MQFEPVNIRPASVFADMRGPNPFLSLPQLTPKVIVDLVDGLATTDDHVAEQKRRLSRFNRFCDAMTGHGARRASRINETQAENVRSCVLWLKDLEVAQTQSMRALKKVAEHMGTLATRCASLRIDIDDLRHDLETLERATRDKLSALSSEIERVGIEGRANAHLLGVEASWKAGRLGEHAPLERLFLAVDALYWGPFGDGCRALADDAWRTRTLSHARDAFAAQLRNEFGSDTARPLQMLQWRETPGGRAELIGEAVRYLADPACDQQPLSGLIANQAVSHRVPNVMSIDRAVDRVFEEVFVRRPVA